MTLRDRFGLAPADMEDLIEEQEQELDRLRAEIEHRDHGDQVTAAGRCTARYGSARCVLLEGHVEDHRLTWREENEIERRDGPGGKPPETGQSGISVQEPGLKGPSERSITCARCGRELHSLEQIRAALELAPGEALGEGQERHPKDAYSFALGHLTCAVADAVRDLACHSGACREGMP
jgi:hypothetical protein